MSPSDQPTALEKVVGAAEKALTGRRMFTDVWVKARLSASAGDGGAKGRKERPVSNPFLGAGPAARADKGNQ